MRPGIVITSNPVEHGRPQEPRGVPQAAQAHAWRTQIVRLGTESTNEIMRRTGTSKTCVYPPAPAMVLSVDLGSQIQALDRIRRC